MMGRKKRRWRKQKLHRQDPSLGRLRAWADWPDKEKAREKRTE